jgi:hypothetical protein
MASSSHSDSGPYKCPTDPCGEFNNLKDFFSKTHLEKHEYRCPMSDCPGKPGTSYNFRVHWMRTHLEHFGLQEEREVCNMCGESYPKGNKFNHERRHFAARPESNKRRRDHAEDEPVASVPKDDIWRISKETYGDVETIMHAGIPPSSTSGSIELVPTDHDTNLEAGLSEDSESVPGADNSNPLLSHPIAFNNVWLNLEPIDYGFGDPMEAIYTVGQQQHLSMLSISTAPDIDTTGLMLSSLTTDPSNSDMPLIESMTEIVGTDDETFKENVPAALANLDWLVDGQYSESYGTCDFGDPDSMLAAVQIENHLIPRAGEDVSSENRLAKRPRLESHLMTEQRQDAMSTATSTHHTLTQGSDTSLVSSTQTLNKLTKITHGNKSMVDRYRLNQEQFKQARVGSRTVFTSSQIVAVTRFALEMPTQSITSFRQWLRKVKHAKGARSSHFFRLKVEDQHIHADTPLVKSIRTIRVSKFPFLTMFMVKLIHLRCSRLIIRLSYIASKVTGKS